MDFMKSLWLLCTAMHFVGNTFIVLRYCSKNRRYLQLNSELVVFYANSKNLNFLSDVQSCAKKNRKIGLYVVKWS